MQQYLTLLEDILKHGVDKSDRTGTGTLSVFGYQNRYNLADGFPLVTTKRVPFKAIAIELLWFLKGDTNVKWLQENGVTIWDEWADVNGELGPIYGKQWRSWPVPVLIPGHSVHYDWVPEEIKIRPKDQIAEVIEGIKKNPDSRRHLVLAWNPADVEKAALPPCHILFQFYVANGKLSCQLYQRSGDVFLGVPFNIASYALLTMMIAQVCGLEPGEFIHTFGDVHLYKNHFDQAQLQLARHPRPLPKLVLNPNVKDIDAFTFADFQLKDYSPHPAIAAKVAV